MDTQELIKLYEQGKSLASLSNMTGMSTYMVKKQLVNNGVTIRTRSQQNVFSNQERSKKVNESYFDIIDSNRKAWILGFMMADGNVQQTRNLMKIALSSVDKEILEKIRTELEIEREIKDSISNKGFRISDLEWSNANHKIQLAKYGIVPRKTYTENHLPDFGDDIDKLLSYILGFYDGDGCFKNDGTTCRIEVCSYRPELLEDIADVLNSFTNSNTCVYKDKSKENYYTLTYSTQKATLFLDYAYSINDLYLKRKYDKYMEWKTLNNRI